MSSNNPSGAQTHTRKRSQPSDVLNSLITTPATSSSSTSALPAPASASASTPGFASTSTSTPTTVLDTDQSERTRTTVNVTSVLDRLASRTATTTPMTATAYSSPSFSSSSSAPLLSAFSPVSSSPPPPFARQHSLSPKWGLSYGLGRRRRVYVQLMLLLLLGVWIAFEWPRVEHVPSSSSMRFHEKTSYLLGRSTCPSPSRPHFPVDQPISSSRSQSCTTVTSTDPQFKVEICPVKTTCNSFSVRIRRTDETECKRMEMLPPPVDEDNDTEGLGRWLKESKGPDSFMIRTNGAQRWVSELSVYEGGCTYRFDVTLSNGGQIWLELWWLYTEYAHFNEISKEWPENHFEPLFSTPIRLDICPDRCPMYYAPRLQQLETTFSSGSESGLIPDALDELPECPLDLDLKTGRKVNGLWFPRHPIDVVTPPVPVIPPRDGSDPLMGVYEHFHPQCKFNHHGKQFDFDYQACTSVKSGTGKGMDKPKKVLFAGDSHGRYVMFHFKHRLDNHTEYFQEMTTDHGPFHFTYDQLAFDFWWSARDEYLSFDIKELGTYDSVLYSFGAWELMAGTSMLVFRQKLETFFQMVQKAQATHTGSPERRNVFLVAPPIPPRLTGPAREKADQRTNHRFAAMRDIAIDLCAQYGWRMVDEFEIATPVVLEINAVDGGHLSPGASHSSIVDEVVAKLGLC